MRYAIYSHKPATIPSKKPHSALPAPSARIRGAVPLRKSELTHLSAAKTVAIGGLPVQCLLRDVQAKRQTRGSPPRSGRTGRAHFRTKHLRTSPRPRIQGRTLDPAKPTKISTASASSAARSRTLFDPQVLLSPLFPRSPAASLKPAPGTNSAGARSARLRNPPFTPRAACRACCPQAQIPQDRRTAGYPALPHPCAPALRAESANPRSSNIAVLPTKPRALARGNGG